MDHVHEIAQLELDYVAHRQPVQLLQQPQCRKIILKDLTVTQSREDKGWSTIDLGSHVLPNRMGHVARFDGKLSQLVRPDDIVVSYRVNRVLVDYNVN